MEAIKNFDALISKLKHSGLKTRVAVVYGVDSHSEEAIAKVIINQFADVIMIGPKDLVQDYQVFKEYPKSVTYIDCHDVDEAAMKAVELVNEGKADMIMKGLINTDNLLRAVLNKEKGLLPPGGVLSHLTIADIPSYDRLLFFSDAAVIPYPKLEQRIEVLKYISSACRNFGVMTPRIALIHFTEKVNSKFPNSVDYVELIKLAKEGEFGDVIVDGPMDVTTACDSSSGDIKGISSPIGGMADALIFPNIESANVFYKTISLFGKAELSSILLGTKCPVVVTSRSDTSNTKFNSIAMGCLLSRTLK